MACEGLGFKPHHNLAEADKVSSASADGQDAAASGDSAVEETGAATVCSRAPYFVLLGAQKAGTTAMYGYIAQHPRVASAVRKETHFLDWKWGIYASCKIPEPLESESFDVLAQSSWEWNEEPQSFAPLVESDFETEQPLPDDAAGGAAKKKPRKFHFDQQKPVSCDEMRQKYLLMFPFKQLSQNAQLISGEASPSYALYGQVPRRLHRLNPS